jgi:hypothetical protein
MKIALVSGALAERADKDRSRIVTGSLECRVCGPQGDYPAAGRGREGPEEQALVPFCWSNGSLTVGNDRGRTGAWR